MNVDHDVVMKDLGAVVPGIMVDRGRNVYHVRLKRSLDPLLAKNGTNKFKMRMNNLPNCTKVL